MTGFVKITNMLMQLCNCNLICSIFNGDSVPNYCAETLIVFLKTICLEIVGQMLYRPVLKCQSTHALKAVHCLLFTFFKGNQPTNSI